MGFQLLERLVGHARTRPDAVAIRAPAGGAPGGPRGPEQRSWRSLCDDAWAFGERLRRDPPPTGTLAVIAANRIETEVALLGALWSGCQVLPLSPDSPPGEIGPLMARAGASALVASGDGEPAADGWDGPTIPLEEISGASREAGEPAACALSGALLLHSSGTQGATKIVRRPAAALDALARNVSAGVGLSADDRMLITIPLCHSYGIDFGLLGFVWSGCCIELHERFVPGLAAASLGGGVSVWPAVPLMLDAVSRSAPRVVGASAPRRVISAGSPLPARIAQQFEAAFGVPVGQLYGASEYGAVAYADPQAPGFHPASVGQPFGGVEIRIVDPGSADRGEALPVGVEGEVLVAAPSMMSGYLDSPDGPDARGFFASGDLGRLDEHGALFVTGRRKLLIDVGGRNVNPLEVEAVLARHPDVAEAVVLGVAFSETAARLKAVVVPRPGRAPSAEALRQFARQHLAPYKVPRSFEVRSEVPRSAAGKILRHQLADPTAGVSEDRP